VNLQTAQISHVYWPCWALSQIVGLLWFTPLLLFLRISDLKPYHVIGGYTQLCVKSLGMWKRGNRVEGEHQRTALNSPDGILCRSQNALAPNYSSHLRSVTGSAIQRNLRNAESQKRAYFNNMRVASRSRHTWNNALTLSHGSKLYLTASVIRGGIMWFIQSS
jgi:hypothetical protein